MTNLLYTGVFGLNIDGKIGIAVYFVVYFLCLVISYMLGSVNCAVLISKLKYKSDIREHGSGNAGATNMKRTFGNGAAAMTLGGDLLKAVIAVLGTRLLVGTDAACFAALACACGHAFPCWFGFKGGKCVAVGAASLLCINPATFLIVLLIFIVLVAFTKYVSLGSVFSAFMAPIIYYNIIKEGAGNGHGTYGVFLIFIMCMLIVFLHRDNIKRLREGTESRLTFGKK